MPGSIFDVFLRMATGWQSCTIIPMVFGLARLLFLFFLGVKYVISEEKKLKDKQPKYFKNIN